ncbi:MAG: penicillin-binding protein 2 [Candidatus Pacebacteria bacterium]|nr:penicillin-binding protein 2 [Candidatus Paceibacterota bacterium]
MQRGVYLVRAFSLLSFLLAGFVGLTCHVYNLQIVRNDELFQKARRKYTAHQEEKGERGEIYDVQGNLLAGNLACRDVLAEPRRFTKTNLEMARLLSQQLDVPARVLMRRFASEGIEVTVKRGVPIQVAEGLAAYHLSGIRFVDSYRRYYPKHTLCANLLGFLHDNGQGVSGVERLLNNQLLPTAGTAVFERDRKGHKLDNGSGYEDKPRNGAEVYLTIDEPIQSIVEEEIAAMVEKHAPAAAYGVMADPRTGAILALAQYPTFDPNVRDAAAMRDKHYQNRVLSHGFEPGSIMKCVSIAGALDYGVVGLNTVVDCEDGYWVFCRRRLRDSGHQYGRLRVWQIVQRSSNIGTAKIAVAMGKRRLYQTLRRFGFGEPVGIGFSDEAPGILRAVPDWDGLSVSRFCIGQGILTTPLQIVQAYCALANDGVMMQPYIIDRIKDPFTGLVDANVPEVKRRVLRPGTAAKIVAAMKMVTRDGGTAEKAAVPGYDVAGKTGTAQKFINGSYDNDKYVASFVGFVPADAPAFVLLVAVDEPSKNGYYGGTVAAPAFSRIAEKTLRYLQVAPARARAVSREQDKSGRQPTYDSGPAVASLP